MINHIFVFLISIASINAVCSQDNFPTWYKLEIVPKTGYSFGINSYDISYEFMLERGLSSEIENLICGSITLTGKRELTVNLRDELYGCRGTLNEREILVLDSNLDGNFEDEEIIFLPELVKDTSIIYSPKYQYPSNFVHRLDVEYDYFLNDQIYKLPHSLALTVFAKYDSINNALYYHNKFYADNFNNLRLQMNGSGSLILYTNDYLPWQSIITFNIIEDGKKRKINLNEKFKIESSEQIYSIDSLDKINKRILVSTVDQLSQAKINGNSIAGDYPIGLEDFNQDFMLLHFWGTWCVPCVHNLPKLNPLKERFPKLDILSIAVGGNQSSTLKMIEKHSMIWPNMYFESEEAMEEHSNFKVYSFPTYMLLDKEKNILGRYNKIEDIESKLNQLVE